MHYLDEFIKELESQCESATKEPDGATMYRGAYGAARVYKKRVYFFELGELRSCEFFDKSSNRDAKLSGLEWVVKGRV